MNPILNMMMGSNANNALNQAMQLKQLLQGGNPNVIYQQMLQNNPQFRQFVSDNQGKSPDQIAQAYGIDPNTIKQLLG